MKANAATWIGMCVFAFGYAASPGWAATDDHATDHEELRAMMRTVKDAVNNNRLDEVLPLLDRDFSLTMVDQTLITEPAQLIDYFRERFEAKGSSLKSVHIDPEADVLTRFLDDRTGVNHGTSTDTYTLKNGRQVVLKTRWSGTFGKVDDHWKIVNLHVGVNMLDNPLLKAAEMTRYGWGFGGLLIGASVGFLSRRRRRPAP